MGASNDTAQTTGQQRAAETMPGKTLNEREQAELKEAFDLFDHEKSGKLNIHELIKIYTGIIYFIGDTTKQRGDKKIIDTSGKSSA